MNPSRLRTSTAVTTALSIAAEVLRLAGATGAWKPWLAVAGASVAVLAPAWLLRRARPAIVIAGAWLGLALWHLSRTTWAADGHGSTPTADACWIALFAAALALAPVPVAARSARRGRRWTRLSPLLPAVAVLSWLACGEATVWIATRPKPRTVPAAASLLPGVEVEPVSVRAADGVRIDAWLAIRSRTRCVLVLAGIGGNRASLVARARFWLERGDSVLLPDLRGTGTSEPVPVTFGHLESLDVDALWALLAERGYQSIGVHAQSLGAAAFCFANDRGLAPEPAFAVLEGMYDDIRHALYRRLPMVPIPEVTLWPVIAAAPGRVRAAVDALRPVAAIAALHAPTLLVQGTRDHKVGPEVPAALRSASPAAIREVAWIEGLGHVDLFDRAPDAYRRAVERFLARFE